MTMPSNQHPPSERKTAFDRWEDDFGDQDDGMGLAAAAGILVMAVVVFAVFHAVRALLT